MSYPLRGGWLRRSTGAIGAVDGLTFDIREGETLGLVGESGCGKSTTGRALLRLVKPTGGHVRFQGDDLMALDGKALRGARRHMQMIFQDPFASLDPRLSVASIVMEPLLVHAIGTRAEREERVGELLALVGLSPEMKKRHPHELSGGQRQRVGIARALATNPRFIVADEPISALDVSVQAQIVNLLADLKERLRLTYLFIAHDLAMVRHLSDRVAVMYLGRIVELGERDAVFGRPRHPYTRALLSAIPRADAAFTAAPRRVLEGEVPNPAHPPAGCRFHTRCPFATEVCKTDDPRLRDLGTLGVPHQVACHHAESLSLPVTR
jgi:oligopeptide/dipeptide ABC transporter ATP-binding protein